MAHAAASADSRAIPHSHANACRSSSPSSRSSSPRFNIADFERSTRLPHSALTAASSRETSYASQANIDDLDFASSSTTTTPASASTALGRTYAKGLNSSFLKRSASKLLQRRLSTSNLPITPPASQPGSGASSPTKSLASFVTGDSSNTSNTLSSSASKASVRARSASRVIFDNYFNGDSNRVHIGVLSPQQHARTYSVPVAPSFSRETLPAHEDGYEPDCETNMSTSSYTRSPPRIRPRRSPTAESGSSTTYAGKIGAWWNSTKQATLAPKSSTSASSAPSAAQDPAADDPLLSLSVTQALFPHGPVDPLNPSSFNDLLTAAEAVISTYQNAYAQRVAELSFLRSETALKQDELEECETRAQHLKMQLVDLSEQCNAQKEKADLLEGMLRDRESEAASSAAVAPDGTAICQCGSRIRLSEQEEGKASRQRRGPSSRAGSDSGFESDGDSVFSAHNEHQNDTAATAKGKMLRQSPHSSLHIANYTSHPAYSSSGNSDLRRENELLRARVLELESAVEGCLGMLSNPLAL
ncbi:uncharacterized protein PV09_07764 [Verruconis gallopava]|uniref:Uncharacterized protein n=1 Tax=Verruconis gallopava TaxID=253628 RepID=A0A0D2A322_9PEZI|nr:uncharacterized protein PV09_07764 [Verruconis gallopava]KIW00785.1 hypothetical protein PV09_07764 [Verruconis gallopava]